MRIEHLSLVDFRCYREADARFAPERTLLVGPNGSGKTSALEAIGYLASLESFRGAPADTLVRRGAHDAVLRGSFDREGRDVTVDVRLGERRRVQLDGNRVDRARQVRERCAATVFTPDDLAMIKGGPDTRRRFLDALVVAARPSADRVTTELDRVLRQRNSLLRQAHGRIDADAARTLDVWDERLAAAGDALGAHRVELVEELEPAASSIYGRLAGHSPEVGVAYRPPWIEGGLASALVDARDEDVRRGTTTTGPHRDELAVTLDGMPARSQASQGEQRCLALALRLAAHEAVGRSIGTTPILLLDDVFSELDDARAAALVEVLPPGQVVVTSAHSPPEGWEPECVLRADGATLAVG